MVATMNIWVAVGLIVGKMGEFVEFTLLACGITTEV